MTSSLLDWMRGVALGGLLSVHVACKPSPSHRPRVSRNGGVFYAKSYQEFHRGCQEGFAKARHEGHWPGSAVEGPLAVALDVAIARPKSSKLAHPRPDADNLGKAPLDAATGSGLWGDDSQARFLFVQKRWTRPGEEAGVRLWVARLKAGIEDVMMPDAAPQIIGA